MLPLSVGCVKTANFCSISGASGKTSFAGQCADVPNAEVLCFLQSLQWQWAMLMGLENGVRKLMLPHWQLTGSPLSESDILRSLVCCLMARFDGPMVDDLEADVVYRKMAMAENMINHCVTLI